MILTLALLLGLAAPDQTRLTPLALYNQGRLRIKQYDFSEALRIAAAGMSRHCPRDVEPCAYFRLLSAEADAIRGKPDAALKLLSTPLPVTLADSRLEARRRYLEAFATTSMRLDERRADALLASAASLARTAAPEMLDEINLFQDTVLIIRCDPDAAQANAQRILAAARSRGDWYLEANALGNLANASMQLGRFVDALAYLQESERVLRTVGAENPKDTGNLGYCYQELGDYDTAVERLRSAIAAAEKRGAIRDQVIFTTNLGVIEYRRGNFAVAKALYEKALAAARDSHLMRQYQITLSDLAAVSVSMGAYDAAERYNREALAGLRDVRGRLIALLTTADITGGRGNDRQAEALYRRIVAEAADNKALVWKAQEQLASMYARQHRDADAEREYRNALATGDAARSEVPDAELRLSFQDLVNGFYHRYIEFLVDRGRPQEALAVAEHARARSLEERLDLSGKRFTAVDARQPARRMGGTILSYWLAPSRSYLWIVTPSELRLEILPPAGAIEALVDEYRNDLLTRRDPLQSRAGAELYRILVGPARVARESRVAIVPDGRLHALNFETLVAGDHYWIEDATVITSSSVALVGRTPQGDSGGSLLLVNGGPPPDTAFPPLPNANEEASRVAREFPRPVVLRGRDATPAAYWRSGPESFDFIHFVAHGVAVWTRPLESSVILSRDAEGYRLYARDVVKRRLRARLVTISSCHGAGVRAYTGEGLVGLAWAFLNAGAHQVVAALWEVNDNATPDLMGSMYAAIRAGRDPAAALREAKLKLLRSRGTVHSRPRYWAPFVLYSGA